MRRLKRFTSGRILLNVTVIALLAGCSTARMPGRPDAEPDAEENSVKARVAEVSEHEREYPEALRDREDASPPGASVSVPSPLPELPPAPSPPPTRPAPLPAPELPPPPVVQSGPVYNITFDPITQPSPVVLAPNIETRLTLSIGRYQVESVLGKTAAISSSIARLAAGQPIDLNVALTCSFCPAEPYQRQVLQFDPNSKVSIEDVVFSITPDSRFIDAETGGGTLMLAIDTRGIDVNVIHVPVMVGSPSAEMLAAWKQPNVWSLNASELPDKGKTDLIIDVVDAPGKLRVSLSPEDDALKSALADAIGQPQPWRFEAGVSKEALDEHVSDMYLGLRALVDQNKQQLQDVYHELGRDLRLSPAATRLRISDDDRRKMLRVFKENGALLYRYVFLNGDRSLRRAMRALESFAPDDPSRRLVVRIRTKNVYAPWQMVFIGRHNIFDDLNPLTRPRPEDFWGFRFALGTRQLDDTAQAPLQTVMTPPSAEQTLFARYRGSGESDEVRQRADLLSSALLKKLEAPPLMVDTRAGFLRQLYDDGPNTRLIVAYGHATSGTVVADVGSELVTVQDARGPRFLFSSNDQLAPKDIDLVSPAPDEGLLLDSQPFVLFTACDTGTGGTEPMTNISFVGALTRAGARVVVVTESPIWNNFAYHFSNDILNGFFEGKTASETVLAARLRHLNEWNNPMGLLFTLYGNSNARVSLEASNPP